MAEGVPKKVTYAVLKEKEIAEMESLTQEQEETREANLKMTDLEKRSNILLVMQEYGKTLSSAVFVSGTDLRTVRVWRKENKDFDLALSNAESDNVQRFIDNIANEAGNTHNKDRAKFAVLFAEMKGLRVQKSESKLNISGNLPLEKLSSIVNDWKKDNKKAD